MVDTMPPVASVPGRRLTFTPTGIGKPTRMVAAVDHARFSADWLWAAEPADALGTRSGTVVWRRAADYFNKLTGCAKRA